MECTWDAGLISRTQELPPELLHILQHGSNEQYLNSLTVASLDPRYTYTLLAHCGDLFPEICATLRRHGSLAASVATLGRIVPFASYLPPFAQRLLSEETHTFNYSRDDEEDTIYLLGLFRLFSYDPRAFKQYVKPTAISPLLNSQIRANVYLAIRILQIHLEAADDWFEQMVKRYLGEDTQENAIDGPWDDRTIDYRFLSLWEESRFSQFESLRANISTPLPSIPTASKRTILDSSLDQSNARIGNILLPRTITQTTYRHSEDNLVSTPTMDANLRKVAHALKSRQPLLLSGTIGSGKTLVARHIAGKLGALENMITLHLNEQSDAKLLIGVYTTGDTPGSFVWKAGVLTQAVQEGRWVFIEDLDRAPNDIIGTLLPLIERGELMIPNRKQTIHAAPGFRIIATVRTTINHRGDETKALTHMLGARHWQNISIASPNVNELRHIALQLNPSLSLLLPQFIAVYERLQASRQRAVLVGQSKTGILRAVSPRDFLKWCGRVSKLMWQKSSLTSNDMDDFLLEAVDCFVGALPDGPARSDMVAIIAEELRIDPQRRDYLLAERDTRYEVSKARIAVGRYTLSRSPDMTKATTGEECFSTNPHTCRMLERVAAAVTNREPLLLVGETGVGKTTAVQHLARHLGKKLVPFNLSQQSEAGDLLGGFKPVNARSIIVPLKDEFDELFAAGFSRSKNQQFLELLNKQMQKSNWKAVCKLWRQALKMVDVRQVETDGRQGEAPSKKRKVEPKKTLDTARWEEFAVRVTDLERRLTADSHAFAFSFVEGSIVKAVRNGDWVLLDEINLASPDTLESIADLFDSSHPSVLLTESGSTERVECHPDFRIFAAMNPATDVGKKDLPPGIRSRFTELYIESPDKDLKSLQSIVKSYLRREAVNDPAIAFDVSTSYQKIIAYAERNQLVDGAGQKPHFSLRTLTRTLSYARYIAPMCSLRRALYEGFHMSFLTFLDVESSALVEPLLLEHILGKRTNVRAELSKSLRMPQDGSKYLQGYPGSKHWIRQGSLSIEEQSHYILTPFIRRNLENLVRASSTRQFPVLIQGPTSSGKTSMIEYLAKRSGHKFVRINNHEHTDLQEYLGTYISGTDGRLQFQDGVLVKALREGHWIVLDELNLAPTDVLEALNRLLDDNRELLIPETQEVIRPHEDFMLFATQNPAGLYGGRKVLSRAFRNRFLELHFDEIPVGELQEILHKRTQLPESRCKRIVGVYRELSVLRQESRMFEQKSFATLRDLFRWALRPNDSIEQLAANGFMLLGERVRKSEERQTLKDVIEKVMSLNGPRVRIDEDALYSADSVELAQYRRDVGDSGVVWTRAMRRLYTLVARAIHNNEPVLLVGETGCGKTTVCQMLASVFGKALHTINAHQNTETGDIIGSQRPVRNRAAIEAGLREQLLASKLLTTGDSAAERSTKALLDAYDISVTSLSPDEKAAYVQSSEHISIYADRTRLNALFEWADGSLIQAMKEGSFFLLDEISLADDSVLERINSVLESQRSILLAEKGSLASFVTATHGFQFFATMNPGGDYGKRELSPALRNRFTEIWVPPLDDVEDITQIVNHKLMSTAKAYANAIVAFSQWFNGQYNTSASSSVSIRDTLSWVSFINAFAHQETTLSVMHGAAMVYIDTLGANPAGLMTMTTGSLDQERRLCIAKLSELLEKDMSVAYSSPVGIGFADGSFHAGPFDIEQRQIDHAQHSEFSFEPPTTRLNTMRTVRAMQLTKPVLLEGNPGVGKTALVTAIADAVGVPLTRINLSEQTDLLDLFGSDVPVEGSSAGTFAWRDAPFLRAMKSGEWVLLDEMNLASQSVLEGLNACLDHRGEVFVPELGQSFHRHPDFRLFAAQNPHHQGGGRKGLPASFVNRFTVVFADAFRPQDLKLISRRLFPGIDEAEVEKIITFVQLLDVEVGQNKRVGGSGGPWEFNLRDVSRWLSLASSQQGFLKSATALDLVELLFSQRFRTAADREFVRGLFKRTFGDVRHGSDLFPTLSTKHLQVGLGLLPRDPDRTSPMPLRPSTSFNPHVAIIQSTLLCVQQNWPIILTGSAGVGKSFLVERLAAAVGAQITTIALNADSDAIDLIGGFEQMDPQRQISQLMAKLRTSLGAQARSRMKVRASAEFLDLCETEDWESIEAFLTENSSLLDDNHASDLSQLLRDLNSAHRASEKSQFEWVDGLLVDALQQGKWLVLDNANLCSPSVLDRLNSLLEQDGTLIINEHSTADGHPQVIRPHPSFRVFLTYDPRYGELSRAMRNRAVELHLANQVGILDDPLRTESSMARFRRAAILTPAVDVDAVLTTNVTTFADHLGLSDLTLTSRMLAQTKRGLFSLPDIVVSQLEAVMPMASHAALQSKAAVDEVASAQSRASADYHMVQTLHPLNNQALVYSSQTDLSYASSVAFVYEVQVQSALTMALLETVRGHGPQVAALRGIERVLCISSAQGSKKYNGSLLLSLIEQSLHGLVRSSRAVAASGMDTNTVELRRIAMALLSILQTHLRFLGTGALESSSMATYWISARNALLSQAAAASSGLSEMMSGVWNQSFALVTGSDDKQQQSCVVLWKALRPVTPVTSEQFASLVEIEAVVDRFDILCHRLENPIDTMADLRLTFARTFASAAQGYDVGELSTRLSAAMSSDELAEDDEDAAVVPHFLGTFKGLHKKAAALMLSGQSLPERDLAKVEIYALQGTTTSVFREKSAGSSAQRTFHLLRSVIRPLIEQQVDPRTQENSLLDSLHASANVSLGRMQLLDQETNVLGKLVASQANHLWPRKTLSLDRALYTIVREVLLALCNASNSPEIHISAEQLLDLLESVSRSETNSVTRSVPSPQSMRGAWDKLGSVVHYLRQIAGGAIPNARTTADAWAAFSTACLQLYVPTALFDPALEQEFGFQVYKTTHEHFSAELRALTIFRTALTGTSDILRSRMLKDDIAALGPGPTIEPVYRPTVSRFSDLKADIDALMRTAGLTSQSDAIKPTAVPLSDSTLENLVRIRTRLENNYREYQDFARPIVGFVDCLLVSHSLAIEVNTSTTDPISPRLLHLTPFLGASWHSWKQDQTFIDAAASLRSLEERLNWLEVVAARSSVLQLRDASDDMRSALEQVFHQFYAQWQSELRDGQEKAAVKANVYKFQGEDEHDDDPTNEELDDLFPGQLVDDNAPDAPRQTLQDAAHRVSTLHMRVYGLPDNKDAPVLDLLTQKSLAYSIRDISDDDRSTLPMTICKIAHLQADLSGRVGQGPAYNIYRDPNISQVKALVTLVNNTELRFRGLHKIFPEQAPLIDVLRLSDALLSFSHTSPLALLFTPVEQLHRGIAQWQTVASREHGVVDVLDEMSNLIVSWRQLELSSWAGLFANEVTQHERYAASWWYIAYENIIAPIAGDDKNYHEPQQAIEGLLDALTAFISTSGLGEYRARLGILQGFESHLEAYKDISPSYAQRHKALGHFNAYYNHFVPKIEEALAAGRIRLEKDVKNIIQLASWKDRNIEVLSRSAKSSHMKLTRLVRKFRKLLAQPVAPILAGEVPGSGEMSDAPPRDVASRNRASNGLAECPQLPTWDDRPPRFRHVESTANAIDARMEQTIQALDFSNQLRSFTSDLQQSVAALQKATPPVLNEENKTLVNHLKTRKRRLLADVLRDMRSMGFQTNMSDQVLVRQASNSVLFSRLPPLDKTSVLPQIASAEYSFHRFLGMVPVARESSRKHSEDLTPAETGRCLSLLESLLENSAIHHDTTAAAVNGIIGFDQQISQLRNLVQASGPRLAAENSDLLRQTMTLKAMVPAAVDILRSQQTLSGRDYSSLVDGMAGLELQLEQLIVDADKVPRLPAGIQADRDAEISTRLGRIQDDIRAVVQRGISVHSEVDPSLSHLLSWLPDSGTDDSQSQLNGHIELTADQWTLAVFEMLDAVLVKYQKITKLTADLKTDQGIVRLLEQQTALRNITDVLSIEETAAGVSHLLSQLPRLRLDGDVTMTTLASLLNALLPVLEAYYDSAVIITNLCIDWYTQLNRTGCLLTTSFIQICQRGFCTPSEKETEDSAQSGNLEAGTGLGDGEGAEDISKDIGDDEDMSELMQRAEEEKMQEGLEDEKDAVDMADEEFDGELGDVPVDSDDEDGKDKDEEEDAPPDEEAGEGDLGDDAVDEKLWDEEGKEDDKRDKTTEESKGKAKNDDNVARAENRQDEQDEDEEDGDQRDAAADEPVMENVESELQQPDQLDPHTNEENNLDLPEDMAMDQQEQADNSDSDLDDVGPDDAQQDDTAMDGQDDEAQDDRAMSPTDGMDDDSEDGMDEQEATEGVEAEANEDEEAMPEDLLQEQQQSATDGMDEDTIQADDGDGPDKAETAKQQSGLAHDGENDQDEPEAPQDETAGTGTGVKLGEDTGTDPVPPEPSKNGPTSSFKRLGDILEQWYEQNRDIEAARTPQEPSNTQERDPAKSQFEHVPDEDTEADAQALGAASMDQSQPMDKSNAVSAEDQDQPSHDYEQPPELPDAESETDHDEPEELPSADNATAQQDRASAFVGEPRQVDHDVEMADDVAAEDEADVDDVDEQLTNTHLSHEAEAPVELTMQDAQQLWSKHEDNIRNLSLILTEHLRLILHPTQATRMRGDFRTGKRLNIKRIIPYIASSYKRDKIWMRRSVPSKRSYQVMLAIDDSKSMAESNSHELAFETLALVAKSMSLLEVGELSIIGFGEQVNTAHDFGTPFTAEAGAHIIQQFRFSQTRTDVENLLKQSIEMFRAAGLKAAGSASDLWQLQLIISDGICEDHPSIRRLIRQAHEERIMVAFIVVDPTDSTISAGNASKQSILDLQTAEFVKDAAGEMQLKMTKYLDTFPFRYYLIVRDVQELPGVLAGALRQWFTETVETGG